MKTGSMTVAIAVSPETPSLSPKDEKRLKELEQVVRHGLPYFVAVGLALKEIRDNRYYRQQADTFEAYMEMKFGVSRRRGYQLMNSAAVAVAVDDYSDCGDDPVKISVNHGAHDVLIDNERKARALVGLKPGAQKRAAVAAKRNASGQRRSLSYRDFEAAAQKYRKPGSKAAPKSQKRVVQGAQDPKTAADQFIQQYPKPQDKIEAAEALIAELHQALPPLWASLRESFTAMREASKKKSRVTGVGEWAHFSMSCFQGCDNNCSYCWAQADKIRKAKSKEDKKKITSENRQDPTQRDWDKVVSALKAGQRKLPVGSSVMFPGTHDITPKTIDYCLRTLKLILEADAKHEVLIVSKPWPECITRLCTELDGYKDRILFRFTIGSADDKVLKFWEPDAPTFRERLAALKHAFDMGFQTSVSMEPLLDDKPEEVILRAYRFVTHSIWLGAAFDFPARLKDNGCGDKRHLGAAKKLADLQSEPNIRKLAEVWDCFPKIRLKDSLKKILGLTTNPEKGMDI
jgi:DNA repair photolyase